MRKGMLDKSIHLKYKNKAASDADTMINSQRESVSRRPVYIFFWLRGATEMMENICNLNTHAISQEFENPEQAKKVLDQFLYNMDRYLS